MSFATGFILSFALIAFGGVGLAIFAITHRQRATKSTRWRCRWTSFRVIQSNFKKWSFDRTVTIFSIDTMTDETLDNLKNHYNATSKTEVLRKAIALLNVASRYEQSDGSIIIREKNGQDLKVFVR
jgi:hypothetical protein